MTRRLLILTGAARTAAGQQRPGVPEAPERYRAVPENEPPLNRQEREEAWARLLAEIRRKMWWQAGADPARMSRALREPASVLSAVAERAPEIARPAAEFLRWAQEQGGSGVFPFPAARGVSRDNAFVSAERFMRKLERDGRLPSAVRNGWLIEDFGDGGLQFDNGEAGVAMFDWHRSSGDEAALASAERAAARALSRPVAANWNYNSFSVRLLARAYSVTGKAAYLEGVIAKTRSGILPGQLTAGPHAGRWADGHNARAVYHYILLQGLWAAYDAMPAAHPFRPRVREALALGLKARNGEFAKFGAPNIDSALEVLLAARKDTALFGATQSDEALAVLGRLISRACREGKIPAAPRPLAMYLFASPR